MRFELRDLWAVRAWWPKDGCPPRCRHADDGHVVPLAGDDRPESLIELARALARTKGEEYGYSVVDTRDEDGRVVYATGKGFGAWPSRFEAAVEILNDERRLMPMLEEKVQ